MGSRSVRNSSVELLRFFFMFMIVIGHAYVHGTHVDYPFIYSWAMEWSTAPHLSLDELSEFPVITRYAQMGFSLLYFVVGIVVPMVIAKYNIFKILR